MTRRLTGPDMKGVQMSPRIAEMLFVAQHSRMEHQTTRESKELVRVAQARRYWCYSCGRSELAYTELDSSGTDLCQPCYDAAGLENEHSDNGHVEPVDGCPTCAGGSK